MPAILEPKVIKEISFVDKGASGDDTHRPAIVFWKRETNEAPAMEKEKVESILAAMPEEDRDVMIEALAAAKQEPPAAPEPEDEEKQDPPEDEEKQDPPAPAPEDEEKQDPPEDEETEKRDFAKALEAANDKIAKLEAEKSLAGFVKVAASDMPYIPGLTAEDLGPVLKAASDNLTPEIYKKLRTTLTACSRAIEKGELFVEVGSGAGDGESALAKLDRLARELHSSSADQTFESCYTKVLKAHPELYQQSRNEGE